MIEIPPPPPPPLNKVYQLVSNFQEIKENTICLKHLTEDFGNDKKKRGGGGGKWGVMMIIGVLELLLHLQKRHVT